MQQKPLRVGRAGFAVGCHVARAEFWGLRHPGTQNVLPNPPIMFRAARGFHTSAISRALTGAQVAKAFETRYPAGCARPVSNRPPLPRRS